MPEGNAIVYCQGSYNTPNGKTAHGLVRFTERYRLLSVIDSRYAGQDAGQVLDGQPKGVPIHASVEDAVRAAEQAGRRATHFVVGLAPDGGRLSQRAREDVKLAIRMGLNVDCGLHDYLSEDAEIRALAQQHRVILRDIRKPPPPSQLHFFSGKIEQVTSFKVALLGTDSAIGKRTTAWLLVQALRQAGHRAEMIGTGQTAWMQGVRYGIVLDSLINDFITGEIEHVVWKAWHEARPDIIVLEGQGGLLNPAYPGGFELLAAARPDVVVLQHAPARRAYDGFPDYPVQPLKYQIQAVEVISSKPVVAVTINHEDLPRESIPAVLQDISAEVGLPAFDVLLEGAGGLVRALEPYLLARLAGQRC